MSRLLQGALIILFYLVVNSFAAFITTQATPSGFTDACSTSNNVTSCESAGKESFFAAVANIAVSGFDDAPAFVNALWVLIGVFLLTAGVLLIVLSFIPLTSA